MQKTIFALSTVFGKSGIAVIRISGPDSKSAAKILGYEIDLKHKQAVFTSIYDIDKKNVLDDVILLFFAAPNSFNGEDILEIHIHGSIAIINDVLDELNKINFLRIAEPGEFTKIAFYNGKMDLVKAEGLADLLDAETSMQRLIAQKHLSGGLSDLYNKWRADLISILSQLEALIDFPEDDIPENILISTAITVNNVIEEITNHLKNHERGKSIMNGINIVISGAPNVGKSSLMNLLAKKDIAIVSDIAGTTRDIIQVKLDLGGFVVILSDTAGLREANDSIEKEGIRRAEYAIKEADINIVVLTTFGNFTNHLNLLPEADTIWLINKSDLMNHEAITNNTTSLKKELEKFSRKDEILAISTVTNNGIDDFLNLLQEKIKNKYEEAVLSPITTRIRQKKNLEQCLTHLKKFSINKKLEMACQDIRIAGEYIGMLTGKIYIEEILDEIFINFCIGK